ncbi:hypothetical protein [Paracoccus jiaweipingae]|uniref:hypothetical protein n=1 Tax=unclassified Paracoccus (in: a-proteobacteria) TaxID=2688777 RepID=UPI0037ADB36E
MNTRRATEIAIPAVIVLAIAAVLSFGGLTAKHPASGDDTAPALMAGHGLAIGDRPQDLRIIDEPGHYGLASPPDGSLYGVADGRIVRVGAVSGLLESVLWPVSRPDRDDL